MADPDVETVVVAVRRTGQLRWFRCNRDWWVLDVDKWREDFIRNGYDVPEFNDAFRFGFRVVNEDNVEKFLACIGDYEVDPDQLARELADRYRSAVSWWDVKDLFPIMLVDFDRKEVAAFYSEGAAMERYVPKGWTGRFVDFATEYPEALFPKSSKFWVKGGVDLLALLLARGS